MPAPMSLLFHPKKNPKKDTTASPPARKIARSNPVRKPQPRPSQNDEEDEELKLPDGPFQEFKLLSSALNGWKYDVMKFDTRKIVDISTWQTPVKLNRKDLRREDPNAGPSEAVKPMLGPDGNQVYGQDGKPIMVDIEGRIVNDGLADGGVKGKGAANGKKKFQKKTRQVFIVPEEVRQLRREERYPWVLEDASGSETWIGQLEDLDKSFTHAFFMPAANDVFKFVPAHRWYKFQKKMKHDMPRDTLSVESAYSKSQKRDPQAWLHQRNGKGPSDATAAMFKAESEGRALSGSSALVHDVRSTNGGRKLKAVDSGMNLFGDDEDDGEKRRKEREFGGEGDLDENVFEEDFADDEEKMNLDDNDEEAKELEERLKKEYKTANKTREGYIDESDEEDTPGKTKQEKAMQKLIRKREGNDAYDSEEEGNPYASSDEEEEEEVPPPAPPPQPEPPLSQPSTEESKPVVNAAPQGQQGSSRATSPVPSMGGHSVVAKRATSPKIPKQKPNASRGSSPLASHSGSPPPSNSRATSPAAAGSPVPNGSQKKRKADETTSNGGIPKPKKRKGPVGAPQGQLEPRLLIEWLRQTPNASTRDCIAYFSPYLTEEGTKTRFTALVKEVAQLKDGILVLRKDYREPSVSPSSPAT